MALMASVQAQPVDRPVVPDAAAAEQLPSPQPDPNYRPGLIDAVGRLIGSGVTDLNSTLAPLGGVVDQAGQAARGAVDAAANVAKLPASRLVDGRERCPTAPNGAPDCRAAALAMCKAGGYASGNSVDLQTTETCPPEILAKRRPWPEGACTIENFVTRALCQ